MLGTLFTVYSAYLFNQSIEYKKNKELKPYLNGIVSGLVGISLASLFAGTLSSKWFELLKFWNYGEMGASVDKIFNLDNAFYLMDLSVRDMLVSSVLWFAVVMGLMAFIYHGVKTSRNNWDTEEFLDHFPKSVGVWFSVWCLVSIYGVQLDLYNLLSSSHEAGTNLNMIGVGYTDKNVRIPVSKASQFIYLALSIIALLITFVKSKSKLFHNLSHATFGIAIFAIALPLIMSGGAYTHWIIVGIVTAGIYALVWFFWGQHKPDEYSVPINIIVNIVGIQLLLNSLVVPGLIQSYVVAPNESNVEKEYINNNIQSTLEGFGLSSRLTKKEVAYKPGLTIESVRRNRVLIGNARVLDFSATSRIVTENVTKFPQYIVGDIDICREDSVLMMYAPIELSQEGLDPKTYITQYYEYGHGDGFFSMVANEYDLQTGFPIFKQLKPSPKIYFQEADNKGGKFFYVNTNIKEYDFPDGNKTRRSVYKGKAGINIGSGWKKWFFGYEYDSKLVFGQPNINENSRILLRRQVKERVEALCPMIDWDEDAHPIITEDSSLVWMVHGYTKSDKFPYSNHLNMSELDSTKDEKFNYIRPSAKAIVHSYDGTVDFYSVYPEEDPIMTTIMKILPGMFKPFESMPADVLEHLIYPLDYIYAQKYMLKRYHQDKPEEFYSNFYGWEVGHEKYLGKRTQMVPRQMMLNAHGHFGFNTVINFTPEPQSDGEPRDFLRAILAGSSDYETYLDLELLYYPMDLNVYAPWKIESLISGNTLMSTQISWLDDKGSKVLRGNMITIPIDSTVVFIEPFYVSAFEDGKAELPSIKLIIAAEGDNLAWGRTVDEAIFNLVMGIPPYEIVKYERMTGEIPNLYEDRFITDYQISTAQKQGFNVPIPVVNNGELTFENTTANNKAEAQRLMKEAILKFRSAVSDAEKAYNILFPTGGEQGN